VNTLLALKHQMARMVDQTLEAMHMPTQAEISTLQCRQQELRRDNLKLQKELKSIQAQLLAMRQSMLQAKVPPSAPAVVPKQAPAKAAAPKAAAPKASAPKAAPKPAAAKPAAAKRPAAPKTK